MTYMVIKSMCVRVRARVCKNEISVCISRFYDNEIVFMYYIR
jgi:hypothetical protein